jgi:DNA-directed RNA polymerase I, II, and III subunit RPABC1
MTDPAVECLNNLDLNKYYRIYTTVHEMMKNRGYTPIQKPLKKNAWISRHLGYLAELADETCDTSVFDVIDTMTLMFSYGKEKLLIYFHPLDSKLCQNDMSYIHKLLTEKKAHQLIIIANNKATPKVSSVLNILGSNAQLFSENELTFNITKHQLVPAHRKVSVVERERLLQTFALAKDGKIHPEVFPGIYTTDPVVRYYNWEVGDLIEIDRPRKDGFYDKVWRIVTHPMTDDKK